MLYLNKDNLSELDEYVLNKDSFKFSFKKQRDEITIFCTKKEEKGVITWNFRGFYWNKLEVKSLSTEKIKSKENCIKKIKESLFLLK